MSRKATAHTIIFQAFPSISPSCENRVILEQERVPYVYLSLIPCSGVDRDYWVICGYEKGNNVDDCGGCEWITTYTESRYK